MSKKVNCPQCKKEIEYSPQNKFRPFCSNRCQLLDLGEWASNKYAVPIESCSADDLKQKIDEETTDSENESD